MLPGRRTEKLMPLKQRKALEAQEEYVLSGAKADKLAYKDNELRHKRSALQVCVRGGGMAAGRGGRGLRV